MIEADCETFMVETCKKWPGKFSDEDLKYWFRALKQHSIEQVIGAMTEFKAHSKYVPKLPEIRARLQASATGPAQQGRSSRWVDVIRREQGGRADEMHDFEVMLRYFRQMAKKAGDRSGYRQSFISQCARNLAILGCPNPENLAPAIYDDPDTFDDAVREAIRHAPDPHADEQPPRETEIPQEQEIW